MNLTFSLNYVLKFFFRLFKQKLKKRYRSGIHSIFAVNSCTEQIKDLKIGVLGLTKFSKMLPSERIQK